MFPEMFLEGDLGGRRIRQTEVLRIEFPQEQSQSQEPHFVHFVIPIPWSFLKSGEMECGDVSWKFTRNKIELDNIIFVFHLIPNISNIFVDWPKNACYVQANGVVYIYRLFTVEVHGMGELKPSTCLLRYDHLQQS